MANRDFPHRLEISVLSGTQNRSRKVIISSLKKDSEGEYQIPIKDLGKGICSALDRASVLFADGVEKVNIHLVHEGMCSDAHYRRESDEGDVLNDEALRTLRYVQVG